MKAQFLVGLIFLVQVHKISLFSFQSKFQTNFFQLCICGRIARDAKVKRDYDKEMRDILNGKLPEDQLEKFMNSFTKISSQKSLDAFKKGVVSAQHIKLTYIWYVPNSTCEWCKFQTELSAILLASKSTTSESEWLRLLDEADNNPQTNDENITAYEEIMASRLSADDTNHMIQFWNNFRLRATPPVIIRTAVSWTIIIRTFS